MSYVRFKGLHSLSGVLTCLAFMIPGVDIFYMPQGSKLVLFGEDKPGLNVLIY